MRSRDLRDVLMGVFSRSTGSLGCFVALLQKYVLFTCFVLEMQRKCFT